MAALRRFVRADRCMTLPAGTALTTPDVVGEWGADADNLATPGEFHDTREVSPTVSEVVENYF